MNSPGPAPASTFPALDLLGDGSRTRDVCAVALDEFEGPLDLLLHLVRRHELDILDIPISFVAARYLEFIAFAQALDIEVAGDYLVMAATLAYLKSRELLPHGAEESAVDPNAEDGVDPREQLIQRLLEYERFRNAALALEHLPVTGRDTFPRGGDVGIEPPPPDLAPITLFRLAEAYGRVLERARVLALHEVELEPVPVRMRMEQLALAFSQSGRVSFESLFLGQVWRNERELRQMLIVTLISVLEMVKLGVLSIEQPQGSDAVWLEPVVDTSQMNAAIADYREEDESPAVDLAASRAPNPDWGADLATSAGPDAQAPADLGEQPEDAALPVRGRDEGSGSGGADGGAAEC